MYLRQILTAGSAAALLALAGCGRGNSVEVNPNQKNPNDIIAPEKHAITITVVDAATGALVSKPVSLALRGTLAGQATDAFGASITSLVTNGGIASFYMNAPGTLNVVAAAEGYFAGGTSIEVKQSLVIGRVNLVNIAAPPVGIKVGVGNQVTEKGRLKDSLRVMTPDGIAATFPRNVQARTSDSSILNGTLQLQLLSYNIDSASVLAALPGGNQVLSRSQFIPLQFLGVLGISLKDSAGREAALLDSAVSILVPVPTGRINPLTGKTFAVGDSLDVVSLSNGTARWEHENSAVVSSLGGVLVVRFKANHLSYWGLRVRQKAAGQAPCAPVVFKMPGMSGINVNLSLFKWGFYSRGFSAGDTLASLNTLPGNDLLLKALWGSSSRYVTTGSYGCGDTVTLNLEKSATDVSEVFSVLGICSQGGNTKGIAGIEISITRDKEPVTSIKTDADGFASASGLSATGQYNYAVQLGGKVIRGSFVPGGAMSLITTTVDCGDITGVTGATSE